VSQTARRLFAAVVTAIAIGAALWGFSLTDDDEGGSGVAARSGDSRTSPAAEGDRPDGPRVPRLIGLTPAQVRESLDPLGLQTEFAQRCEGRTPRGRVIRQIPGPGQRADRGRVELETDWIAACSGARTAQECDPADLELTALGNQAAYAGGSGNYAEWMFIENVADEPCQLRADGSMQLASLDGLPPEIRGAPARVSLDLRALPNAEIQIKWIWTNWCRPHGKWTLTARLGGLEVTDRSGSPICRDEVKPSVLYGGGVVTASGPG
jgi:hypothetical protein